MAATIKRRELVPIGHRRRAANVIGNVLCLLEAQSPTIAQLLDCANLVILHVARREKALSPCRRTNHCERKRDFVRVIRTNRGHRGSLPSQRLNLSRRFKGILNRLSRYPARKNVENLNEHYYPF